MNLPVEQNLPIHLLASCFKKKVATYKYYWFLAIIEEVENGRIQISKQRLFTKMVANAWYTVNYFKLSFGKPDQIHKAVEEIKNIENLTIDISKHLLIQSIENSTNNCTLKELNHFDNEVPHRFLTPWFPNLTGETDARQEKIIYERSSKFENDALYALYKTEIIINPKWVHYLQSNAKFIRDFCYWNLALFLQSRNPNVPDIPNKLIKPIIRNPLTHQRNNYWKNVFQYDGYIDCIFTGTKLYFDEKNYAIDHFVPHAFVSHDLIWNLIPIEKSFNSIKSDKLPSIDLYLNKFIALQERAFDINKSHKSAGKYLEEYLTIFPSEIIFSQEKLKATIIPLLTIAHNNGFQYLND
jgi:hypothetical protein